ncbi:lysostaphin resistance A-like protein [Candidatus Neomarinimicrobiota bacterium]
MKNSIINLWNKIPAIIRAFIVGMLIQVVGVMPIFFLVSKNLAVQPNVPWALLIGLLYVWIFWGFLSGKGWPFSNSIRRKELSRTKRMIPGGKKWAIITGIPFSITLIAFSFLGYLLAEVPLQQVQLLEALNTIPITTAISLIFIAALITGFVEETAWRGYAQKIIEEKHKAIVAIFIVALIFTIIHFLPLIIWPIFVIGSLGWGYLAYLSKSIVPGIIFHFIVDFIAFLWGMNNLSALKSILVHNVFVNGMNSLFYYLIIIAISFGTLTVFSLLRLRKETA